MFPPVPYKRVVVKFPPDLLRKLDKLVKATDSNRSEVIRVAVIELLTDMRVEATKESMKRLANDLECLLKMVRK